MFVPTSQVMDTPGILIQLKRLKLGHSDGEGLENAAKTRSTRPLWRPCYLLDEVTTVRIVRLPNRPIGFSYQLRDDVRITHRTQEVSNDSELPIRVDLLEKRLTQACRVVFIIGIWSTEPLLASLAHDLLLEIWASLVVLREANLVLPRTRMLIGSEGDAEPHIGIPASGERSQRRDATSLSDSVFEAASYCHYVVQESNCIQKIGLTRGVRPNEKRAPCEININLGKVAPVAEPEVRNPHRRRVT